mmetsp:Transcript_13482/g.24404  ORF Transcript_13482/g.24404 Transcript_13482/m.24404 type:complete len:236 (-) Transcript_13482:1209-1916(-)
MVSTSSCYYFSTRLRDLPDCDSANEEENCSNDGKDTSPGKRATIFFTDFCPEHGKGDELRNKSKYNGRAKDSNPHFAKWLASNRPESRHGSNSYDTSNESKGHGNLAGRIILEVSHDGTAITASTTVWPEPCTHGSSVVIIYRWAWGRCNNIPLTWAIPPINNENICLHKVTIEKTNQAYGSGDCQSDQGKERLNLSMRHDAATILATTRRTTAAGRTASRVVSNICRHGNTRLI